VAGSLSHDRTTPVSVVAEGIFSRAQRFAREGRHLAAALEYQALADLHRNDVNAALRCYDALTEAEIRIAGEVVAESVLQTTPVNRSGNGRERPTSA